MTSPSDNPVVSVCIQTYQHRHFIAKCLDSVLNQKTNFPFEIILGEDDSTDGTREICEEYAKKHPSIIRVFLRSRADKIYVDNLMTGRFNFIQNLQQARGRYIALVDGDDFLCDDLKLQKQFDMMEANPQVSLCGHSVVCLHGKKLRLHPGHAKWPAVPGFLDLEFLLRGNFIPMSSSMFRKKDVANLPEWYWEVPIIDYPLHVFLATKGDIGFLPECMVVYRIHPGSIWSAQKAPRCHIILWRLYSLMATHWQGRIGSEMRSRRRKIGEELTRFYQTHRWHPSSWFRKELSRCDFPEDAILLDLFDRSPRFASYIRNFLNFFRFVLSRLHQRTRRLSVFGPWTAGIEQPKK